MVEEKAGREASEEARELGDDSAIFTSEAPLSAVMPTYSPVFMQVPAR